MGAVDYSAAQLRTIKQTVAKDTNDLEFDLFIQAARSYGLDPFRKQISAIVFNANKPDKRQMAIIVGRDGLRTIATRCGDYRPASEKPEVEYDASLIGPENPKGIVSVAVRLWKQDKSGQWFPVYGEAYWDEFAPIKQAWEYNQEQGRRVPSDKREVDGNWAKMPIVMLTKCAEGQALRAGWPDQFGNLYAEEEMHAKKADMTASEEVAQEEEHQRKNLLGKPGLLMTLDPSAMLQRVPMGEVFDRCAEMIRDETPEFVHAWAVQNREPLREFWADSPNDALELKKLIEAKTADIGKVAAE